MNERRNNKTRKAREDARMDRLVYQLCVKAAREAREMLKMQTPVNITISQLAPRG